MDKFREAFLDVAYRFAKLSTARRLQVGCIIVKDYRIISIGYNGTPSGWDNNCEYEDEGHLFTKPEVLHAESNAIAKLARSPESGAGAQLICTHQPCMECSKLIYQTGITEVCYAEKYRNSDGIEFLDKAGVTVYQQTPTDFF